MKLPRKTHKKTNLFRSLHSFCSLFHTGHVKNRHQTRSHFEHTRSIVQLYLRLAFIIEPNAQHLVIFLLVFSLLFVVGIPIFYSLFFVCFIFSHRILSNPSISFFRFLSINQEVSTCVFPFTFHTHTQTIKIDSAHSHTKIY